MKTRHKIIIVLKFIANFYVAIKISVNVDPAKWEMERRFTIDNHAIKHRLFAKIWKLDAESKFIVDILEELLFNKAVNFNKLSQPFL